MESANLTGASGAIFGRELSHAREVDPRESLAVTSRRPEMRAVGAMLVSPRFSVG
jgi:hypothetical protein